MIHLSKSSDFFKCQIVPCMNMYNAIKLKVEVTVLDFLIY